MLVQTTVPVDLMPNTEDGPLDKNFEKLVKETLDLWHVPGVSVAVVDGEKIYAQVRLCSLYFMCSTFLLGLRYRISRYTCNAIHTLLCGKYYQSIHRCGNVTPGRRQ